MTTKIPAVVLSLLLFCSLSGAEGKIKVVETSKGNTIVFPNGKTQPAFRGVQKTYIYQGDAETSPLLKDRQIRREAHDRVWLSEDGRFFAHKTLRRDFFVYTEEELKKYQAVEETIEPYGPTMGKVLEQKLTVGDATGRILWEKEIGATEVYLSGACDKVVVHYYHPLTDRGLVTIYELRSGKQVAQWPVEFGEDLVFSASRRFTAMNGWTDMPLPGCHQFVYDLLAGRIAWTSQGCQWDQVLDFKGETLVITSQDTDKVVFSLDMMKEAAKERKK